MKDQFNISGLFYMIDEYKFRKYLNIKKKNSLAQQPDLMVIMMNPGGSKPVDGIDNNTVESEAIPDRTQDQIMKVMLACGLDFARVLNLSDVREPKSNKLFPKLLEMDNIGILHSIFDASRSEGFDSLFIKGIPAIFAWGVDKKLQDLAVNAIKTIDSENPIGIAKNEWAYYHPLPQDYNKQREWVSEIISLLNNEP